MTRALSPDPVATRSTPPWRARVRARLSCLAGLLRTAHEARVPF